MFGLFFKYKFVPTSILILFGLVVTVSAYNPQYVDAENKIPIIWKNKKIPIVISNSFFDDTTNLKSKNEVIEVIRRSFRHWEKVADVEFEISFSDKESVSSRDSNGDGVSIVTIAPNAENLLLFDGKTDEVSAITRLFYRQDGIIQEADIVLNPVNLFTTDGTFGSFDLESTLTHEIGHLLGLGHSLVFGSTMHSHQGKNGVYSLPGFGSRSLSDDDKAGAIALYGSKKDDTECCGSIRGQLTSSKKGSPKQFFLWAEETVSGKVLAGVVSDSRGNFKLAGLPEAEYNIFAQALDNSSNTVNLDQLYLNRNQNIVINQKVDFQTRKINKKYLGFNGQLSNLAIPVSAGKSYIIYIGLENFDFQNPEIRFNSKKIKVNKQSIIRHNYDKQIKVLSFEILLDEDILNGEYSFSLINNDKEIETYIGGITVENANTP